MDKIKNTTYEAFAAEALVHLDALYGMALRMTRNAVEAEDLVQETLLKAFRYFSNYQRGTNCKAWLHKIMVNVYINRYNARKKRPEYLSDDEGRPLEERAVAPESHPLEGLPSEEDELYHAVFGDEVRAALEAIPEDYRTVVLLADLQDFAYKEIAEIVGCPIGTVMSRLHRGRKMLRDRLSAYALSEGVVSAEIVAKKGKKAS